MKFRFLIIVLIMLGIFLRFTNLDLKVYWGDETSTSSRISGYTFSEIRQHFSNPYEINAADLKKFQQLIPEKNWLDVVQGLATEEPQLPPVYFLSLRSWVQWLGNSVTATRGFSALVSLFALPGIYWLAQELFKVPAVAWISVGLFAISPFHLAYAQEARPQSIWTVTILFSSAALLRAMRVKHRSSWGLYIAALVLSFYTYLFSALVAICHGFYVLLSEGFRLTKTTSSYLVATTIAGLLTIPWILATALSFGKLDSTTGWVKTPVPIVDLIKTWSLNISRLFIDFNYNFVQRDVFSALGILASLTLVIYAIYFLCRYARKEAWLFILLLIGIPFLFLAVPDVVAGGRRSGTARYLIPSFIGIQLAVTYLIASKSLIIKNFYSRWFWKIITVLLISLGISSCLYYSQAKVWWNKYNGTSLPDFAAVINQSQNPTIISTGAPPLEFLYLLKPEVKICSLKDLCFKQAKTLFVFSRNYSNSILKEVLQEEPNLSIRQSYVWKQKVDPTYEFKIMLWHLGKKDKA